MHVGYRGERTDEQEDDRWGGERAVGGRGAQVVSGRRRVVQTCLVVGAVVCGRHGCVCVRSLRAHAAAGRCLRRAVGGAKRSDKLRVTGWAVSVAVGGGGAAGTDARQSGECSAPLSTRDADMLDAGFAVAPGASVARHGEEMMFWEVSVVVLCIFLHRISSQSQSQPACSLLSPSRAQISCIWSTMLTDVDKENTVYVRDQSQSAVRAAAEP